MSVAMRAIDLRCEHREDVPCLDVHAPRFGWALTAGGRDRRQTAYRVLVGESAEDIAAERGALWDSGRVESAQTLDVVYGGGPLPRRTECFWAVRVWDEAGEPSPWSETARFRTGLGARWTAVWITRDRADDPRFVAPEESDTPTDDVISSLRPAAHLRREFTVSGPVRRAVLYVTARGLVETYLNGRRVGDAVLSPGWTDYRRRIEYAAHDVTDLVHEGANALGAVIADGWYSGYVGFDPRQAANHYGTHPELLCELRVESADRPVVLVRSDADWRATESGPIRYADLLHGERYDARAELPGWSQPGYDDRSWTRVVARERDGIDLVPERSQPIRVTEDLRPVSISEPAAGVHVFDLGQNMVGWVRLAVEGPRGAELRLRFAEMLEPDGSLHVANLRGARATDSYVLRGGGQEIWEPRFTFHGFRYVEVTGLPTPPTRETVTGRVVHNVTPRTGTFSCSNQLVNKLWQNIDWGQRGNFLAVPTDCPQRDERMGWLADAQVFLPTATLNRDVAAFVSKWGDDILDAQSPDGAYSDVAPRLIMERDGAPGWADAGIIVPWVIHRRYGDTQILERHWDAMERYMAVLRRHNPQLLRTARRNNDYGDWLAVGAETPREVLATAYWAHDARLMGKIARVLGKSDRAGYYDDLRAGIVEAFNRAYVREDGVVEGDTQTAYLLALHMDLLPDELRPRAAERLVNDIERRDWHLTTGFLGVALLCPTLAGTGHADVAHRLLAQETFPSWGYSIKHGATTIWERWDGWTTDEGFQTPAMNSFNHYSLGSVGQFLYEHVGGIRSDTAGYEHAIIAPVPGPLQFAHTEYRSVRGRIVSDWSRDEDSFDLSVEIPPNVTATVVLPPGDVLRESGAVPRSATQRDDGSWQIEIGSGWYEFEVTTP